MKKVVLGEVCDFFNGGAWSDKEYVNEGIPVLKVTNCKSTGFQLDNLNYLSEKSREKYKKNNLIIGDIIVATVGSHPNLIESAAGRSCIVNSQVEGFYLNQNAVCIRTKDKRILSQKYLGYLCKCADFQHYIQSRGRGAANQMRIAISSIKEYSFTLPDFENQQYIADILSAYDDLIENNQKQIKLLEEAAQRLYKEWFVDLRFPGHENTKIVDGVPEGWRVASIADICDTVGGGTPSTKIQSYYEKGDILWVTPTDITRNFSLALLDTEKKITPEGLKNSSANMLPAETILMTSRASVGFFGMCKYEVCTNQGFISCIPKRENLQMYLLFNLKSRVEEIRQKAGGSTYLEISKTVFRELKIILPKDEVLAEYQKNVHDIFDEIYCRTEMIKSLVDMRNRLLPKLMSGEVEV